MVFTRVSTGDSHIHSSCEMKDGLHLCTEGKDSLHLSQGISGSIPLEAENTESLSHTYFWGKVPLEVLVESWLSSSVEYREWALISRWYGVRSSFIQLLSWNWCSYRLEMGVSGNLWIVVRMSSHFFYIMWNAKCLWIQWKGNVLHLELIWCTPIYLAFLRWHQCSSLVVTVFLGILFSSIRKIEVP